MGALHPNVRIGVVGATGAVGAVTLSLLAKRGHENVRAFASARSAGSRIPFGMSKLVVEEATPEALSAGDLDVCFFSVKAATSSELVPHAIRGGAVCIDKSSAFRLEPGVPLIVPEVNGSRVQEHAGVIAVPNCCAIPLTCALHPLRKAVAITRVRVATYQSASGAGAQAMERLRAKRPEDLDLAMDWDFDGEEFEEETKLREETRKVMELPSLPVSATTMRVPVLVGHSEAVWIETAEPLSADAARALLAEAPGIRLVDFPTPAQAAGSDDVLVGRVRPDRAGEGGLSFLVVCDNLRKGAALNAIQIAELLPVSRASAFSPTPAAAGS